MTAFVSEPESIDSLERPPGPNLAVQGSSLLQNAWARTWNADKSELERSQRVLQQLRAILLPLQQR